ncbi:MAG: helix-turn-helix domain-containing protein [Bacillota bacterium]|nr:helix-turn-helix domain-containing protein [Bacillota bacterium]
MTAETINWIPNTPLGVNLRRITFVAPHAHENMIEITMCLEGSITFDYCFEEFRLREGEFILVDRDTHYMHSGENALCASFYLDLTKMPKRFGNAADLMFVCEGTAESTVPYNTRAHKRLKGMLIAVLDYMLKADADDPEFEADISRAAVSIMEQVYYRFDYTSWKNPGREFSEKTVAKVRDVVTYLFRHYTERITLQMLADHIGMSKGYMSNLLSQHAIGFEPCLSYIRSWHAERLLLTTDMSIAEISEDSGFSAVKYMYSAFNYWYHCTPGEYRLKYLKEMKKPDDLSEVSIDEAEEQVIKLTNEQLILMYIKGDE